MSDPAALLSPLEHIQIDMDPVRLAATCLALSAQNALRTLGYVTTKRIGAEASAAGTDQEVALTNDGLTLLQTARQNADAA